MTAKEFIDYIQLNHYEKCEIVIVIGGKGYLIADAWGIGNDLKIEPETVPFESYE